MTFGTFSKNNEIVAMKANGVSLYRMAAPVMVIGIVISIVLFFFSEFVTPASYYRARIHSLGGSAEAKGPGNLQTEPDLVSGIARGFTISRCFDIETNTLHSITINYLNGNFVLKERIDAESAVWQNNRWIAKNVLVTTFRQGAFPLLERSASKAIDLPETPEDFKTVQKDADKMGFFELWKYIKKLQSEGYDATRYVVDLHGKIAISLVSILLVVIGVCFFPAVGTKRRRCAEHRRRHRDRLFLLADLRLLPLPGTLGHVQSDPVGVAGRYSLHHRRHRHDPEGQHIEQAVEKHPSAAHSEASFTGCLRAPDSV